MKLASQGTTSEEIENTLLVGGIYTLGLDYGKISIEEIDKINKNMKNTAPNLTEENIYTDEGLGEILNGISKGYFTQLELANRILSESYNVSTSKFLSAAIVGYEPIVKYMFKQPVEISRGSIYRRR